MNTIKVDEDDSGIRVDRWFKRHYSGVPFSLMQKLFRKGAIKVDGKKAKPDQRLETGQEITVPNSISSPPPLLAEGRKIDPRKLEGRKENSLIIKEKLDVIYQDKHIIAINKPAGLAVQGGSKVKISVDDILSTMTENGKRPKLVHRLDKDTSGVLLVAKTSVAATRLTEAFRKHEFTKIYWGIIIGVPRSKEGKINLPLSLVKAAGNTEKMVADSENGKSAVTYYKVIETAGRELSWVMMMPTSGRKHQLRVHLSSIGHPILSDGKYGGRDAFIEGLGKKIHLHARRIIHHDCFGRQIDITASLSKHMKETWKLFGFDIDNNDNPFERIVI